MKKILLIILSVVAAGWGISLAIYFFTYPSRKHAAAGQYDLAKATQEADQLMKDSLLKQKLGKGE